MIKKIGITTLVLCLSIPFFGQKKVVGFEGRRITIEAGAGFSYFPTYYYTNNSSDEIKKDGIISFIKPSYRINYRLGYVLTNKIHVQALYSQSKMKYGSLTEEIDEIENSNGYGVIHYHSFEDISIKGVGIKFSYNLHDFIAPVGGSLGLSFMKNYIRVKNHSFTDFSYVENDRNGYDYFKKTISNGEYNMTVNMLSFHYDNMFFYVCGRC